MRCHSCRKADAAYDGTRGSLCLMCAEREHPGQTFYRRRWRTRLAVAKLFVDDRAYRGVSWERIGDELIGREGRFEIRLKLK